MAESLESKFTKIATETILQAKAKRKFSEITSTLDILVQQYEKQKLLGNRKLKPTLMPLKMQGQKHLTTLRRLWKTLKNNTRKEF